MQDLYFFFEKSECKTRTPYKIGNSYLNHFAINEDAAFEIRSVDFLQQSSAKMAEVWKESRTGKLQPSEEYKNHESERFRKENFDAEILTSCMQQKLESKDKTKEKREIHIIYVGHYYNFREGLSNI